MLPNAPIARLTNVRAAVPPGRLRGIAAALAVAAAVLAVPGWASAHVNRTVGPYTILVVLIGEPYFADNRAGFSFWVKEGDSFVGGLDRSLQAIAMGPTGPVPLRISAERSDGFYDVEFRLDGRAFNPGRGGDWSLQLTGSIEDLAIHESFRVSFPVYPRVVDPAGRNATPQGDGSSWPILVVVALAAQGAVVVGLVILRLWRGAAHRRLQVLSIRTNSPSDPH